MKRRDKKASGAALELQDTRVNLSRDPLAAQVVYMLAGRKLDRAALIRRLAAPPAKVTAVLGRLVEHGMVACRQGRRPRYGVNAGHFAAWFARMAASPETRASAGLGGFPVLELEVGEFGGWHPVVVWSPKSGKLKVPGLMKELGGHPAFRDLLERFLVRLREGGHHALIARSRCTLADLAGAFEIVLLQAGGRLAANGNHRARALARMLGQWHDWRMAAHTLPEQAWLESFGELGILAPVPARRVRA